MQVEGKEVLIASAVAIAVVSIMWRFGKFLFVSLTGLVKDYFESIKQSIKVSLTKSSENEKCIAFIKKDVSNLADKIREILSEIKNITKEIKEIESLKHNLIELESDVLKLLDDFEKHKDHHDEQHPKIT